MPIFTRLEERGILNQMDPGFVRGPVRCFSYTPLKNFYPPLLSQKNKAPNLGLYSLKIFNLSVTGRKSVICYLILFFILNQVAADHFILAVDGEIETLYLTILKLYLFFVEAELLHEEILAILMFLFLCF